jgi:hypothetical protein
VQQDRKARRRSRSTSSAPEAIRFPCAGPQCGPFFSAGRAPALLFTTMRSVRCSEPARVLPAHSS